MPLAAWVILGSRALPGERQPLPSVLECLRLEGTLARVRSKRRIDSEEIAVSVVIPLRSRIPNLYLIFLIWLLAVPCGAGVTDKEIASLSLDNQTRIGIHVYYFPHAHTVHLRLDDYNRSDDKRWQEIDLVPEQWEKFKSALLQAGESSGAQQIATLVDFDQGRGSWLKVAADLKAGGARLTLARPDSYTRGQGDEAGQVVIGLTAESVKELATHFSAADQALKDGPPMVAPAGSVWKLHLVEASPLNVVMQQSKLDMAES